MCEQKDEKQQNRFTERWREFEMIGCFEKMEGFLEQWIGRWSVKVETVIHL